MLLALLFGSFCRLSRFACLFFLRLHLKIYSFTIEHCWCVVHVVFVVLSGLLLVMLVSLCPPRDHACQTMSPCALPYPLLVNFPLPCVPQHPYAPFQSMCAHLHSLHSLTYCYACARVCSCFCVFVARTVCARMLVFALVDVSVLVFCVYLCVHGCPVCLSMC